MEEQELVSIIVCTYNRCEHLKRTLESLTTLDYSPIEIIVVDNNSTDETEQVAREFPVRYLKELRPGVAHARNCGLQAATGTYVGFVDDDETVIAEWVQGMLQGFALSPDVAAVTGPVYPVYEVPLPRYLRDDINVVPDEDRYKKFNLIPLHETMGTGNSMFRRSALDGIRFRTELGRRQGSLLGGEDSDFIFQIYANGYRAAYSPNAAVYHSIPKERLSYAYFIRRYFFEGVTEYVRKGARVFWRRLLKPIPGILSLLLALLTLQPTKSVTRLLRLCQTLGILYGPIFMRRSKRLS